MAKAITLDDSAFQAPVKPPRASPAAPVAANDPPPARRAAKVEHVPLQIRIPRADAKAIKRDALEADQSISDFMLACYHASRKA